jgi:hypothetical protein
VLEGNVLPFDVAEIPKSLGELRRHPHGRNVPQDSHSRDPGQLLRIGRERPREKAEYKRDDQSGSPDPHPVMSRKAGRVSSICSNGKRGWAGANRV